MAQAEQASERLHEIVLANPGLRYGSYSNALEEWAEGALTIHWAETKTIMSMSAMAKMYIQTVEYIGALSDFTGEVGRMAVVAAGTRDLSSVRDIHNCIIVIAAAFQQLNASGKFTKKIEAVNGTMKKLEDVVYELTLVTRGGRSGREKAAEEEPSSKDDE
jgi:predicted translin family RNA/ssDNA-binding protein